MAKTDLKGMYISEVKSQVLYHFAKQTGIDFLFYDCEHGFISQDDLKDLMFFGNTIGIPSFVRVSELSKTWISKTLDMGAGAIMVPMIETKEQALEVVRYAKYPPLGRRSYSGGPHTNYSHEHTRKEFMEMKNRETITIAQIESETGVKNCEEIISTKGIDAVIVGPCDLSISMGLTDDELNEKEIAAVRKVADTCRKYGKLFGIIGKNEMISQFSDDMNITMVANDIGAIVTAMHEGVKNHIASSAE